jgi:Metallo-beta-lactamase superfamily
MPTLISLDMLPAAHGDCLWIEYGTGQATRRILIDGGPAHTYPQLRERILRLPVKARHFELLVITHIDADHIEGVVRLLQDAQALGCSFDRIWFNGREQLDRVPDPAGEALGAKQGEMLGLLIKQYEARTGQAVWNKGLPDGLAMVDRQAGQLPVVKLPGGCALTLLSPDADRLLALKTKWHKVLGQAHWKAGDEATVLRALLASKTLKPLGDVPGHVLSDMLGGDDKDEAMAGRFETPDPLGRDQLGQPDDALGGGGDDDEAEPGADTPFGSDTSLELTQADTTVRLLLAGDAWAAVMEASVDQLLAGTGTKRLSLDGFKLPHHGSAANITPTLLGKLQCGHFLVSTSGAVFRHPHARAINLLIDKHPASIKPALSFNYLTQTTEPWADEKDQAKRKYSAGYTKTLPLSW